MPPRRESNGEAGRRATLSSASNLLTDHTLSAEFMQLVAKHAPLEMGLLLPQSERRSTAGGDPQDRRRSLPAGSALKQDDKRRVSAHSATAHQAHADAAAAGRDQHPAARHTPATSRRQTADHAPSKQPSYHVKADPPKPAPRPSTAGMPVKPHVQPNQQVCPMPQPHPSHVLSYSLAGVQQGKRSSIKQCGLVLSDCLDVCAVASKPCPAGAQAGSQTRYGRGAVSRKQPVAGQCGVHSPLSTSVHASYKSSACHVDIQTTCVPSYHLCCDLSVFTGLQAAERSKAQAAQVDAERAQLEEAVKAASEVAAEESKAPVPLTVRLGTRSTQAVYKPAML